jgi:hypothetical protein
MDLPMMRVLALVCRHDGADKKELMTHLHGYAPGSVTRLINDLGTAGERYGRAKLELVEMGPDRKTHLTPKGVELRDRLFALL